MQPNFLRLLIKQVDAEKHHTLPHSQWMDYLEEKNNISEILKNVYFKGYPTDILKKKVIDKLGFDMDFGGVRWPKK
ncbi:MAG: hypothetical protein HRT92_05385 [Piscirickettsiaceae bacterium]|nr:hypothetical protein [Piscirickettsiaceae bacterium]